MKNLNLRERFLTLSLSSSVRNDTLVILTSAGRKNLKQNTAILAVCHSERLRLEESRMVRDLSLSFEMTSVLFWAQCHSERSVSGVKNPLPSVQNVRFLVGLSASLGMTIMSF